MVVPSSHNNNNNNSNNNTRRNNSIHNGLYWLLTVTTAMSGGLGFLFKLDGFYNPDAYLVYNAQGQLRPGDGSTPFEVCATYVIAVTYLGPLVGMAYAKYWQAGSPAAQQAAAIFPLVYHAAMVPGVFYVFPHALNPVKAPRTAAAAMHVVYAALFYLFFATAATVAKDDKDDHPQQPTSKRNR
jgi:hypothetical protein